jgi:hypothetical protein
VRLCSAALRRASRTRCSTSRHGADWLVGDRAIDTLLLSIGINDLGFATIAERCVQIDECWKEQPALYDGPVAALPGRYEQLNQRLKELFPTLSPNQVFINEYPDNTRKGGPDRTATSAFCDSMLEDAARCFRSRHARHLFRTFLHLRKYQKPRKIAIFSG